MIQVAKKISWAAQKLVWLCVKNISKTRLWPWQKRWNAWKIPTRIDIWCHSVSLPLSSQWSAVSWARRFCKISGKDPTGKASGFCLDPWDVVRFTHIIRLLECPGEMWATQRAFLLPHQERQWLSRRQCRVCGNAQRCVR